MEQKIKKLSKNDMVIVHILRKNIRMETEDFERETHLSVRQIRNSLKKLKNINVVITKVNLLDTRRKFYHYNPDVIIKSMMSDKTSE